MEKAIEVLKRGGIILYPTDTIWGLGCDATNASAVEKINLLKGRDASKSYIVLLDDDRKLNRYVRDVPAIAWDLVEFSTKPTTIVYDEGVNLAQNVLAADNSIGIRIVKEGFCHDFLRRYGKPLVATSANISGEKTPSYFADIDQRVIDAVDYVLELPKNEKLKGTPSTVIKLGLHGDFKILRK